MRGRTRLSNGVGRHESIFHRACGVLLGGAAGGIAASKASAGSEALPFMVFGVVVGFLCYVALLTPGILIMRLAPERGFANSKQSTLGQWVLITAGLAGPYAAFLCTKQILSWVEPWFR